MIQGLPARLAAPVLFVVGKGGTGKSTAAAAIALHAADRGQPVRLISTDPAHSLADVTGQLHETGPFSGTSHCSPNLEVEEFAAADFARRWLQQRQPELLELLSRGTYLDAADAEQFLGLSIPGVDEAMAALRLLELAAQDNVRVVVDTAPTGHLLRLVQASDLFANWAAALAAMHAKASAVALALVGSAPATDQLVAELEAQSRAFTNLLRNADFLIVTRGEELVEAEAGRLADALRQRGLRVAAVLANRSPAGSAEWFAPAHHPPPAGCAGLRAWLESVTPAPPSPVPAPELVQVRTIERKALWDREFSQSLLLVAGKGGVGKSTVASALSLALPGRRCLISVDPAGSLSEVWDQPVTEEARELSPGLLARQLSPDRELARLRSSYATQVEAVFRRLGLDHSVALDRAVIDRLWGLAPPGLDEIAALTVLLAGGGECERTILDSAPTGHFLRLLELPGPVLEWTHALMRVLLRYRMAGALEDFTREVLALARRTRALQRRLHSPAETGVVLVTLDEPVVWYETERLHAALARAKIPVAALIVNRASDGPHHGHSILANSARLIRVPQLAAPPQGTAGLRAFLSQWEVLA